MQKSSFFPLCVTAITPVVNVGLLALYGVVIGDPGANLVGVVA